MYHRRNPLSIPAHLILMGLWAGVVLLGNTVYAREKSSDTLHIFKAKADTIRLGFDNVLPLSAVYDSADREDWHYIYRWNTGERTDAVLVKFNGQRKVLYTGQRLSAIHWPGEYETFYSSVINYAEELYAYYFDPKDDTVILCAPDMEGTDVRYAWWNNFYGEKRFLPDTEQYAFVYRDIGKILDWPVPQGGGEFSCRATAVSEEGDTTVLLSSIRLLFGKKNGGLVQTPQGRRFHDYNIWSMPEYTQIYARLSDTLHFFPEIDFDLYPQYADVADLEFVGNAWAIYPGRDLPDFIYDSAINIYFKDNTYRNLIQCDNHYRYSTSTAIRTVGTHHYVYWGIKPNAQIESDSLWVFFPQYPYSNLGGRVDICLPPDAPLSSPQDTMQVFNLGPWNRELEYVEYAWFDGTKDALGRDSVVGTDSAFAYLFGRMDSINPKLYAGMLVTRVASDSLWQDSCNCYIPCTDDACHRYDTVRIYLHRLPLREQNFFLPPSDTLCAHQDLELQLPDTADNYRCFWLDQDGVPLPYGHDTARYTVQGMHGLDGFGANTDTRSPRFFQLRLDHKLCGVSYFDTLLVYDQVKPTFELPVHDTVICLNEPVELDSLTPFVYRPFYNFEWNDGTQGSGYTFTDSGLYILKFFVKEDFAICGYDTTSDTIYVRWSDPAQTLITLEDTSYCEKLSVILDATVPFPTTRYSWQEGSLDDLLSPLDDSTLFNSPIFEVDKTVSLALFVVDTMNCVNTRQIEVTEEDCKPNLSIPNVFTPNGDGVNDVLKFKQIDYCYDVDILIVDRKGSHVLHQKLKNPDDFAWNGCLNNGSRKLPDGAYFYFISYKNAYGKKKYQSGSITILGSKE